MTSGRVVTLCIAVLLCVQSARADPPVPALTGRVVDLAEILSPETEAVLTERLAAHEDSTANQIAVLTIPSLDGAVLEEYATEVFRAWGLGQAEADNGVLLLVARDDREIRIEVGYGLEGSITDARAGRIIRDEMTPLFRNGDFDGGVLGAATALVAAAEGRAEASDGPRGGTSSNDMPWPFALLFGSLFGGIPMAMGYSLLVRPSVWERYLTAAFLTLFIWVGSGILTFGLLRSAQEHVILAVVSYPLAFLVALFGGGFPVLFTVADLILSRSPSWQKRREHERRKREAFKKARRSGSTSVVVDGRSYRVPTASSGSSGGGSSFSGGGGSSGGGGASGGW